MPNLRPFRDYDEKDVINLYALSGTYPINKGTLVKLHGSGFNLDAEPIEMMGNMGTFSVGNTVAQRYRVSATVTPITAGTDPVIGMTLFDAAETDENGEQLKYNPRKAAEMETVISGQAIPLVTRGIFTYSGIITGNSIVGNVAAGQKLYAGSDAALTTQTTNQYLTTGYVTGVQIITGVQVLTQPIATALGATNASGFTVIKLDI